MCRCVNSRLRSSNAVVHGIDCLVALWLKPSAWCFLPTFVPLDLSDVVGLPESPVKLIASAMHKIYGEIGTALCGRLPAMSSCLKCCVLFARRVSVPMPISIMMIQILLRAHVLGTPQHLLVRHPSPQLDTARIIRQQPLAYHASFSMHLLGTLQFRVDFSIPCTLHL